MFCFLYIPINILSSIISPSLSGCLQIQIIVCVTISDTWEQLSTCIMAFNLKIWRLLICILFINGSSTYSRTFYLCQIEACWCLQRETWLFRHWQRIILRSLSLNKSEVKNFNTRYNRFKIFLMNYKITCKIQMDTVHNSISTSHN